MKKILYSAILFFVAASCDTPNQVLGNPDPKNNTSGTTGSANMTNSNNVKTDVRNPAGTPSDTSVIKKDSLPR